MNSCDFFQMEKRTNSDYILEEELHTINWQEVDTYPVLFECKEAVDARSLDCFTKALHNKILYGMQQYAQENAMDTTIKLHSLITIHADKSIRFSIDADSSTLRRIASIKLLKNYIQKGLDSLTIVEPAFKRGIPVTTEFELPIIFMQENE